MVTILIILEYLTFKEQQHNQVPGKLIFKLKQSKHQKVHLPNCRNHVECFATPYGILNTTHFRAKCQIQDGPLSIRAHQLKSGMESVCHKRGAPSIHLTESRSTQYTSTVHGFAKRGLSNDVIRGSFSPGAAVSLQQLTRVTQHVQFVLVAAAEQNTIISGIKRVEAEIIF